MADRVSLLTPQGTFLLRGPACSPGGHLYGILLGNNLGLTSITGHVWRLVLTSVSVSAVPEPGGSQVFEVG